MSQNKENKPIKIKFNVRWIYYLLLIGIGYMFFAGNGSAPQKEEWADVKKQWLSGDIKEVVFVRNEYEGRVTIRPDRLAQYEAQFKGKVPAKSPQFIFLVSGSFNAEEMFGELNAQMPEDDQVKVVIENHESWWSMIDWLIFPLFFILMWFFMFRGMNKNMGGGGGGDGRKLHGGTVHKNLIAAGAMVMGFNARLRAGCLRCHLRKARYPGSPDLRLLR